LYITYYEDQNNLIKFAYNNGIGNKTQYVFGMMEVI
jgi:CRISPR/Cas system endoribonuclease Cas6 (RAMP superfamily)